MVATLRTGIGAKSGYLYDASNTGLGGGAKQRRRRTLVQSLKGLMAVLADDTYGVDDDVDIGEARGPAFLSMFSCEIALYEPGAGETPLGRCGVAYAPNDVVSARGQLVQQMAADKTGCAGDQDIHAG